MMGRIFSAVERHAAGFPSKLAIIEAGGGHRTFAELASDARTRAAALRRLIEPGAARVALSLRDGIENVVNVLALNLLRASIVPLNPELRTSQVAAMAKAAGADLLVSDSVGAAAVELQAAGLRVVDRESLRGPAASETVAAAASGSSYDPFLITLSSGSTGRPKPIVFSESAKILRFEQAVSLFGVDRNDTVLCASPFFHSLGQRLTFLPLLAGGTLVVLPRFSPTAWVDAVAGFGVTFTIPVSSHLHALVGTLLDSFSTVSTLRCLVSSSASIDASVKRRLFETLPCEFHEMYGASEVATVTTLNRSDARAKPDSVGRPCPGVHVRIVDERSREMKPRQIGEIAVKSPLAFSGYFQLPEQTEEACSEGYFLTGDLGFLDEDGFLYFVDRKKDVIISGGMNLYPSDVEDVLRSVPGVKDCAVVGIRDGYLGEVAVAVLASDREWASLGKEVRAAVNDRLAPFQRPLRFFVRDALPLTDSGKVNKKALREELNALNLDLTAKMRSLTRGESAR